MQNTFARRTFLGMAAAAGFAPLAGGIPKVLSAAEADTDDRFNGWPVGVQSYSLRKFDLPQALRHIQGLGLHHVEFFPGHFDPASSPEQIAEMAAVLKQAQLSISAHGVNNFTKNREANRKLFEFARAAGMKNITANPQPDSFDHLDELVDEFNIRICIHNHGPDALYDGVDSVAKAVEGRHELIGACVDTGHVLRSNQDPVAWVKELGPRVFAMHLKDVAEKQKRTHDVVLGTAYLDVPALFAAMHAAGFPADGSLSIEYESNPDNPIDDIEQCLGVVEQATQKVPLS